NAVVNPDRVSTVTTTPCSSVRRASSTNFAIDGSAFARAGSAFISCSALAITPLSTPALGAGSANRDELPSRARGLSSSFGSTLVTNRGTINSCNTLTTGDANTASYGLNLYFPDVCDTYHAPPLSDSRASSLSP